MKRYQVIAGKLAEQIDQGVYVLGERMPGIRQLSQDFGVSVATIVHAHQLLEDQGYLEARSRSGHYVARRRPLPLAQVRSTLKSPVRLAQRQFWYASLRDAQSCSVVLGNAIPHRDFLPVHAMRRAMSTAARLDNVSPHYMFPPGFPPLRRQIAKRMLKTGAMIDPEQIIITAGAQEAVRLALQAVAKDHAVIAVESPVFYGILQVIESLKMRAVEIPTDPQSGISLQALKLAAEQWQVQACVVVPHHNNPLGYTMPNPAKAKLLQIARQYDMRIIEDDVYGDLGFDAVRPTSLLSMDKHDRVMYCSSFSKTVMPGLRIGWCIAGSRQPEVEQLKFISNIASASLPQAALAYYLSRSGHEKYLRRIRSDYAHQMALYQHAVLEAFPDQTKVSHPSGGFVLWVECPTSVDIMQLYQKALQQGIHIAVGPLFTAKPAFNHCLRLNVAIPWQRPIAKAIQTLGSLARE